MRGLDGTGREPLLTLGTSRPVLRIYLWYRSPNLASNACSSRGITTHAEQGERENGSQQHEPTALP